MTGAHGICGKTLSQLCRSLLKKRTSWLKRLRLGITTKCAMSWGRFVSSDFYAQIASERQLFNFKDVAEGISRKLIRRHPHIFDNPDGDPVSESEVKDRWEQIKAGERENKQLSGAMDDVPQALPALSRSQKLQKGQLA
ncbi:MAG: hypothetical protein CM15mP84_06870 [Cellvibrionales bacterium]|nr:MAG: hypothetical protein CM15mP84_06870 [Cellvibrionales bacterium]